MKRVLVVDLDTDREKQIKIGLIDKDEKPNPILDMGVLCEAVVTLIHLCHQANIKSDSESVRNCIRHITNGFAEAGYIATLAIEGENEDANARRNAKTN
jgi:hypothetical protein